MKGLGPGVLAAVFLVVASCSQRAAPTEMPSECRALLARWQAGRNAFEELSLTLTERAGRQAAVQACAGLIEDEREDVRAGALLFVAIAASLGESTPNDALGVAMRLQRTDPDPIARLAATILIVSSSRTATTLLRDDVRAALKSALLAQAVPNDIRRRFVIVRTVASLATPQWSHVVAEPIRESLVADPNLANHCLGMLSEVARGRGRGAYADVIADVKEETRSARTELIAAINLVGFHRVSEDELKRLVRDNAQTSPQESFYALGQLTPDPSLIAFFASEMAACPRTESLRRLAAQLALEVPDVAPYALRPAAEAVLRRWQQLENGR